MTETFPLVSIIIPTYNRPHMISNAIKSVLEQTYKNIEIIVVDDNNPNSKSRMDTEKEMSNFINNPKIKYLKLSKNLGGALARNKGASIANGKYICFLDDDDIYIADKIELQVKTFLKSDYNLAVVGGFANVIDNTGTVKRIEKTLLKGDVFKYQLAKNICTTSIAMIKKDVFDKVGGFEKMPSSQEHMLFIKIFAENPYYDYVSKVVVNIIHHEEERISTNSNKPLGALKLMEKVESYYYLLDEEEIKKVKLAHYENIIRSYMEINKRKNTYIYIKKYFKIRKKIDKNLIKNLIIISVGIKNLDKIRKILKNNK